MFDYESKIQALVSNYGLQKLIEMEELSEYHVIDLLVENGDIDLDDYINLDNEIRTWKEWEE